MFCILWRHHNLALNKIISLFLKLSQSLLVFSHYIAFILLLHLSTILQTHDMNLQNMISKQMQSLFNIIWVLQTEVTDLRASHTLIFSSLQENLTSIATTKSEKLSDLLMFENNQKKLHSFVTKLCLKLQENTNKYSMKWNKMNYTMFWLEENIISTVNFFYHNDSFSIIILFIVLLKQTYDDANYEYTAMIKLETFWQKNHKFTSFFSEFLDLVDELNWNESVKIAALQHVISDEIHAQLVTQKMSKILSKFAILCQ